MLGPGLFRPCVTLETDVFPMSVFGLSSTAKSRSPQPRFRSRSPYVVQCSNETKETRKFGPSEGDDENRIVNTCLQKELPYAFPMTKNCFRALAAIISAPPMDRGVYSTPGDIKLYPAR